MIITFLNQKVYCWNKFLNSYSKTNLFTNYLSIFRIYISFHIIKSAYLTWNLISLFDRESAYITYSFPKIIYPIIEFLVNFKIFDKPLYIYLLIIFSINLFFGFLKNFNFVFLFILFKIHMVFNLEISNGGFNYMSVILFFMCFTNSWRNFAVVEYKETRITNLLSNYSVYSIMIQLCMIYLVSGLNKIHADVWFNGSATYYILNTIPYCSPIMQFVKNNVIFIIISTYFTLFFEIFFCILIWIKKIRPIMILSGILLHLSIYFTMMLYDFQILFIFIYGFFIADFFWEKKIQGLKKLSIYKNFIHK